MHIFYDVHSPRLRGELGLFLLDVAALAGAALYVSGALSREFWWVDGPLVVLWAGCPRALAKIADLLHKRAEFGRALRGTILLVGLIVFLVLAGWELVVVSAPRAQPVDPASFGVLALAWGSGFLLFDPRAYRLCDLFLLSTLVIAAKGGVPGSAFWIPVVFAIYLQGCALRHLLHEVVPPRTARLRRRRLNLQNPRAAATLGAVLATIVFFTVWMIARSVLTPARSGAAGGAREDSAALLAATDPGAGEDGSGKQTSADATASGEATGKRIGLRYRVSLRDLAMARYDPREAVHVAIEAGPWRPGRSTLWKAASFSTFDATLSEWSEESVFATRPCPLDGKVELARVRVAGDVSRQSRARVDVLSTAVRNFIVPYYTLSVSASGRTEYRINEAADVFPVPDFRPHDSYSVLCLGEEGAGQPPRARAGAEPTARNRSVPDARRLGLDLEEWLRTTLGKNAAELRQASVEERISLLAEAFTRGFRYSDRALWPASETPLARFLREEKIGDCTYHATAVALLLRVLDIPTRLAVGYLGAIWDPERRVHIVRNGQAHSWVEVYSAETGWYPVDPTRWVPFDGSYRPPPDLIAAALPAREVSIEGAAAAELALADRPEDFPAAHPWSALLPDAPGRARPSAGSETELLSTTAARGMIPAAGPGGLNEYGPIYYEPVAPIDPVGSNLSPIDLEIEIADGGQNGGGAPEEPAASEGGDPAALHPVWHPARPYLRLFLALASAGFAVATVRAFLRSRARDAAEDEDDECCADDELAATESEAVPALNAAAEAPDAASQVIAAYERLQRDLVRTRNHRRDHQTPLEHGREHARKHARLAAPFNRLHRALYRAVYGKFLLRDDAVRDAHEDCRRIRRTLG